MSKPLLFLLIGVVLMQACRRAPRSTSATPAATVSADTVAIRPPVSTTPATAVSPTGYVTPFRFTYLTGRSDLSYNSPQQTIDNATLNWRIRQDSAIWLSASKLGIEAMRLLFTTDSVAIMDKLHREYTITDYASLSQRLGVQLTYSRLQALLVGNLAWPDVPAAVTDTLGNLNILRQQEGAVEIKNYVRVANQKIQQLTAILPPSRTLQVAYESWKAVADGLVPDKSRMVIINTANSAQTTTIQLQHSRIETPTAPPGFPFSIPPSYRRR